jgi:hypothetical protein
MSKANTQLAKKFSKNGYYVIKNINDFHLIKNLEKKVIFKLDKPNLIKTPKLIKSSLYTKKELRGPLGLLKYNLNKKIIKKGIKFYKNKTNAISFKQPLINFNECLELILNDKVLEKVSLLLGKNIKLGYVALSCQMNNKLEDNDINFFHTDDHLNKSIIKKNKLIKLTIPISTQEKIHRDYTHIRINKFKIKNRLSQYFSLKEVPSNLKKKIISPPVRNVDGLLFDPNNFYHLARKPKRNIRIMLYIVFIKKRNYLETKAADLKIKKKDFKKLKNKHKKFLDLLTKV